MQHHAEPVMAKANVCPMVDQIEYHPGFTQKECVEFCQKNNILVEAWSPLERGNVLDNPLLKSIAASHGKSVAQVVIRWVMQTGVLPLASRLLQAESRNTSMYSTLNSFSRKCLKSHR